jgi:hypothetical protein
MKKHLLLFFLTAVGLAAVSQIVIEKDDLPKPGDSVLLSTGRAQQVRDANVAGAAHYWDFSYLTPVSQQTEKYVNPFYTPFAYQFYFNSPLLFPQYRATVAQPGSSISGNFLGGFLYSNVYNYYRLTNNIYAQVGFGAELNSIPASERYIPIDTIFNLPLNFGDVGSCFSSYSTQIPGTGSYTHKQKRNYTVDGYGTLLLPMGEFEVVRVKTTYTITDSVYTDASGFGFNIPQAGQVEYKWLAKNEPVPVLTITARTNFGFENVNSVKFKDTLRVSAIDFNENEASNFIVYPNPSKGSFVIESGNEETFTLYNQTAQAIQVLHVSRGMNFFSIGYLSSGVYFIASDIHPDLKRKLIMLAD